MQSLYQLYPKISHIPSVASKVVPLNLRKAKIERQSSLLRMDRKDSKTLMNKYSQLCKKYTSKGDLNRDISPRGKNSLSSLKDYEVRGSDGKNGGVNNFRVENVISTMNDYSEELKTAIVREPRKKKKAALSYRKLNQDNAGQRSSMLKQLQDNPQTIALRNPLMTKYSNKSVSFKTINVLYRAIIDSKAQRKKKQVFEVNASKLPIIDRFNLTKRLSKFREQGSFDYSTFDPSDLRSTKTDMNKTTSMKSKHKLPVNPKPRDDVDIIPWSIQEEKQ